MERQVGDLEAGEHAVTAEAAPDGPDRLRGLGLSSRDGATSDVPTTPTPTPRRRRWRIIGIGVLILLAVVGGAYWYAQRDLERTDDAFVDGNAILIAPRVDGAVAGLWIDDNQQVAAGELLMEIDPRDYQAALDDALGRLAQAKARELSASADLDLTRAKTDADIALAESSVHEAEAQVERARAEAAARHAEFDRAQANLPRYQNLARANAASKESLDQAVATSRTSTANAKAAQQAVQAAIAQVSEARARLAQAKTAPQQLAVKQADVQAAAAQVEAAQATVDQARLDLSYTRVFAPAAGHVARRAVNLGDNVQKNQTLVTLVSGVPWVTANFKETQLTRMRPGQSVEIRIDAYPDRSFHGRVNSIQRGTGARFSLLPPENATGNYVKVVQRVPVKIVFDDAPAADLPLALGMSVVPTVDVSAQPDGQAVEDPRAPQPASVPRPSAVDGGATGVSGARK